jgi:hypothetical protein
VGGWLASPLVVTVVAAVLGSWLIPQFTRGWQDHQKALEIKTGLVSQMSESVSDVVATGRFVAADLVQPASQQHEWNDGYRRWTTASAVIGAKLRAYAGSDLGTAWSAFADAATDYLLLSADTEASSRRAQVAAIRRTDGVARHVHLSQEGWAALRGRTSSAAFKLVYPEVARGLVQRRDELVQGVLDSEISGF